MKAETGSSIGENFDLREMLLKGRKLKLAERTRLFEEFLDSLKAREQFRQFRLICSDTGRTARVWDEYAKRERTMLMFGSNNYLGYANNPCIRDRALEIMKKYGTGIGGPPILNGYTKLHKELEERFAAMKGAESALLFTSGYGANLGMASALITPCDVVVMDESCHASFADGLRLGGCRPFKFRHNDMAGLEEMLEKKACRDESAGKDLFVAVEGVYSMSGDIAPLGEIVEICRRHGAFLIVDDAHGTGVLGGNGHGTAEKYGVEKNIDATVGTFSKSFAVSGGFVAADKAVVEYLRYFANSYMFSASMPPVICAVLLASLEELERDKSPVERLRDNVVYAGKCFREHGFDIDPQTPILPIHVGEAVNLREASRIMSERGVFVNAIEFPAVPVAQQCFRASLMADHTKEDIETLAAAFEEALRTKVLPASVDVLN